MLAKTGSSVLETGETSAGFHGMEQSCQSFWLIRHLQNLSVFGNDRTDFKENYARSSARFHKTFSDQDSKKTHREATGQLVCFLKKLLVLITLLLQAQPWISDSSKNGCFFGATLKQQQQQQQQQRWRREGLLDPWAQHKLIGRV